MSGLHALDGTERAPDTELEGERILVATSTDDARAGQGTLVELRGLHGSTTSNPLTEGYGPLIATALTLMLFPTAVWGLSRTGRQRKAPST